jgi:hypothetical protein
LGQSEEYDDYDYSTPYYDESGRDIYYNNGHGDLEDIGMWLATVNW